MRLILIIVASSFFLFSCQKEKEVNLLKNKWQYISVNDPIIFHDTTYWAFDDSKVYVIKEAANVVDTMLWGDYYLKNNMMVITGISTTMVGGEYFKGNFQLLKLDENQLILVRKEAGDGLIYHEFVKSN